MASALSTDKKTVRVHAKHYKHEDGHTAPVMCGNSSVPLSHAGNVVTRIGIHTCTHGTTIKTNNHTKYIRTVLILSVHFHLPMQKIYEQLSKTDKNVSMIHGCPRQMSFRKKMVFTPYALVLRWLSEKVYVKIQQKCKKNNNFGILNKAHAYLQTII